MSNRSSSKYKINRRLSVNLWGRPKSPFNKRDYPPGQHGQRRRKVSDFGIQLRAKQKLRGYYGNINEKQFRRIYAEAVQAKGDTSENLIGLLERRLDTIVYRMLFVPTVFAARQLINHRHVRVNGKRVNIPSYLTRTGDVIKVAERSRQLEAVHESLRRSREMVPWLVIVKVNLTGTVSEVPSREVIPTIAEEQLVIEFYSRV